MTAPFLPLRCRSLLYTPGDRGDRIEKAWKEGLADVVVADLEDAVAPDRKAEARRQTVAALRAVPQSRSARGVRINAWPGRLAEEDLAAVLPAAPDLIVLPKAQDPEAVAALARRLAEAESSLGLPAGRLRLIPILETPLGVLRAHAVAAASPRVAAVCFGAEDLAAEAGMRRSRGNAEVAVARAMALLGIAAAGVPALDMITADFRDVERCREEAKEARGLGYSGKMCIHPAQVAAVHDAFRPSPEEVVWARKVMEAVSAAGVGHGGVVVVDGKMVDVPVIKQAERILRDAA